MSVLPHLPVTTHQGATLNFEAIEKRLAALEATIRKLEAKH
jgi:hypothetical protein